MYVQQASKFGWREKNSVGRRRLMNVPFSIEFLERRELLTVSFVEYKIPTSGSSPTDLTLGPDGNIWFTEQTVGNIGQLTPSGQFAEFSIPKPPNYANNYVTQPVGITAGSDGNLWFTESDNQFLGKTTPVGVTTLLKVPQATIGNYGGFSGITQGPDGNIWATNLSFPGSQQVVKAIPSDLVTTIQTSSDTLQSAISTGPDGALWFASENFYSGQVTLDRLTTTGNLSQLPFPSAFGNLNYVVAGPDNNLWFTENGTTGHPGTGGKIARVTTSGQVTEFSLPDVNSGPSGIAVGADGNLWFTEQNSGKIGRITTTGGISEFTTPFGYGKPSAIITGLNGTLWYTDSTGNRIVQVTIDGVLPAKLTPTAAAIPATVNSTYYGPVGSFTTDPNRTVMNPVASINWGDSTQAIFGTITPVSPNVGVTTYQVAGQHQYAQQGVYTVTVTLSDATGVVGRTKSLATVTNAPIPADGQKVIGILGESQSGHRPRLLLTFSSKLAPATAENPSNYQLESLRWDRKAKRLLATPVALQVPVYNPRLQQVAITPVHALNFHLIYRLTARSKAQGGLIDTFGHALDGAGTGKPGSDFQVILHPPKPGTSQVLSYPILASPHPSVSFKRKNILIQGKS